MNIELAKASLMKTLTDPALDGMQEAGALMDIGKRVYGLNRADMKAARKELGVLSENFGGTQYWRLPEGKGGHLAFQAYLRQYARRDTPAGDFAGDAIGDRSFPHDGSYEEQLQYLADKRACSEAIRAFKQIRCNYERIHD